jgi:hypothetical protein
MVTPSFNETGSFFKNDIENNLCLLAFVRFSNTKLPVLSRMGVSLTKNLYTGKEALYTR